MVISMNGSSFEGLRVRRAAGFVPSAKHWA